MITVTATLQQKKNIYYTVLYYKDEFNTIQRRWISTKIKAKTIVIRYTISQTKVDGKLQIVADDKTVALQIFLYIKTSSFSYEILEVLMVQMAGIEPARVIRPQDFKILKSSVILSFLILFNTV